MSFSVNKAGDWTEIPPEPNKAYCNKNGAWTPVKEIWVAGETVTIGVYEWRRAWRVPEPPAGVSIDAMEQVDSGVVVLIGGDVRATWVNATTDYAILVEWEINSSSFDTVSRTAGSTNAILDRSNLSGGDEVRARMRYFEGSVQGDWGPWSDTLTYVPGF
jgi:hypothetical protein